MKSFDVVVIVRSSKKIEHLKMYIKEIIIADITKPENLKGLMTGSDVVISSVGITRQKDGLTYMDVDYACNKNLLDEALVADVQKFMYIAALNGKQLRNLKIMEAKERFVDYLQNANIESYVIRPSGFFSDITEMYKMAQKGKIYVFGKGEFKANPIHGADLAEFCIKKLTSKSGVYEVGGPDILSQTDIAKIAFASLNKKVIIQKIPVGIVKISRWCVTHFTNETTYGPIEFFLTVLIKDMIAPRYGSIRLKDYFNSL